MNKLDQALETSLTRMQLEGASIEDCLKNYPELVSELKPLLIAAQNMGRLKFLQPSAQFKAKLRGTLNVQMAAHPRKRVLQPAKVMRFAVSLAVLALAFLTTGTALAQRALPGDVLYPWKLESESVWRSFQTDTVNADIVLGRRRIDELKAIQGMPQLEEIAFRTYATLLARLGAGLVASPEKVAGATQALNWQKAELKEFFEDTESVIPDLDQLFDVIPDVDSSTPEDPQDEDEGAVPDVAIPPVIPAIPPVKKDDEPEDSEESESTILEDISDLLGLP
jgi:hypothetical protein